MFIVILSMLLVICFILNLPNIKFNNKKILLLLLVSIIVFVFLMIFINMHNIVFFFQSLKYDNIDNYNYSNDITNNGHISEAGAIKIAKNKTNHERIAKVTCELVENGTYTTLREDLNNLSIKDFKSLEKQATYWNISLITGWNNSGGHEEQWFFKIDYYTGEILYYDSTI